ncbi:MAG: carbohydrate binding domain-containing protein [candidate division FCPU426 bacterium]
MKKSVIFWLAGFLLFVSAGSLAAFPLWLDTPARTNSFDPQSKTAEVAPPSSGGGGGGGGGGSAEQVGGLDSANNARCDGCDGYFWYGSSEDFGGTNPNGDPFYSETNVVGDAAIDGSSDPWDATTATLNSNPIAGTHGSSVYAGCISGQVGEQASPWPYVEFQMPMAAANAPFNVAPLSKYRGVTFDYKARHFGDSNYTATYRIRVGTKQVADRGDYDQFSYEFTPADGNWHTLVVYFRGYGKGQPEFERTYGAQAIKFDMGNVEYVEVIPTGDAAASKLYDICLDNISFNVPAPPAPPSTLVATLENFESALTGAVTYDDGVGSTISQAISTSQHYAGAQALAVTVNAPADDPSPAPAPYTSTCTGCWGAAVHFDSATVVDASTATHLRFRIKPVLSTSADVRTMDLTVKLTEENVSGTDVSNERWTSSQKIVRNADSSCWTTIYVPLSSFDTEDIQNGQCATSPDCGSTGDNTFNMDKIKGIDVQFNSHGNTIGTVYVDDVQFVN